MVNSYHQKTFIITKSNIMSKSNFKILQCKQHVLKVNYTYSIEQGIFKKWWRLVMIYCLKKILLFEEEDYDVKKINFDKEEIKKMGGPTCEWCYRNRLWKWIFSRKTHRLDWVLHCMKNMKGVILVRTFSHSDWITPNTGTFYAVLIFSVRASICRYEVKTSKIYTNIPLVTLKLPLNLASV